MTLTHAQLLLFLAGAVLIVFLGAKRIGDRRRVRILAAFDAEVEAERQCRVAAGFAAGWHGGVSR